MTNSQNLKSSGEKTMDWKEHREKGIMKDYVMEKKPFATST